MADLDNYVDEILQGMPDPLDAYIDELLSEIPDKGVTADLDHYIDEILRGMLDPLQQFTDLEDRVPHPVRLPADRWVTRLTNGKDEFEVDGAVEGGRRGPG